MASTRMMGMRRVSATMSTTSSRLPRALPSFTTTALRTFATTTTSTTTTSTTTTPNIPNFDTSVDVRALEAQLKQTQSNFGAQLAEALQATGDLSAFKTPSHEERLASVPALYTAATPCTLQDADRTKYFFVSEAVRAKLAPSLARYMAQEFTLTSGYMMFREVFHDVRRVMFRGRTAATSTTSTSTPTTSKPIALHGDAGSGKSSALLFAHLCAEEAGWLRVHVRADDVSREKLGLIKPNPTREGIFDQPLYTAHFFRELAGLQREQLAKVVLKRSYADYGTTMTTLLDLVERAAADTSIAPRILYDFIHELRLTTELPVLVTIDNLNVWDGPSEFVDPNHHYTPLPSRRLAMADAFSAFQHITPINGVSMFAVTAHATKKRFPAHFNLRVVRDLNIPVYSHTEFKHALLHYNVSGVLFTPVDGDLLGKIKGLSGAVPKDVFKVAIIS